MAGVNWARVEKQHADELAAARAAVDEARSIVLRLEQAGASFAELSAARKNLWNAKYSLDHAEYAE